MTPHCLEVILPLGYNFFNPFFNQENFKGTVVFLL